MRGRNAANKRRHCLVIDLVAVVRSPENSLVDRPVIQKHRRLAVLDTKLGRLSDWAHIRIVPIRGLNTLVLLAHAERRQVASINVWRRCVR